MKKNLKSISLALVVLFAVSACNTIGGVGRDLQSAGDAITGSANDNKNY